MVDVISCACSNHCTSLAYGKPLVTKLHVIETGFNDVVNHTRDVVKHAHDVVEHTRDVVKHAHDVVEHTHDVVEHVHGGGGFDDVLKHSRRREVWMLWKHSRRRDASLLYVVIHSYNVVRVL